MDYYNNSSMAVERCLVYKLPNWALGAVSCINCEI